MKSSLIVQIRVLHHQQFRTPALCLHHHHQLPPAIEPPHNHHHHHHLVRLTTVWPPPSCRLTGPPQDRRPLVESLSSPPPAAAVDVLQHPAQPTATLASCDVAQIRRGGGWRRRGWWRRRGREEQSDVRLWTLPHAGYGPAFLREAFRHGGGTSIKQKLTVEICLFDTGCWYFFLWGWDSRGAENPFLDASFAETVLSWPSPVPNFWNPSATTLTLN